MQYLECGKVKIPMCYVQAVSWNRKARTAIRTGGYLVPRGFETTEVSIRATFNVGIAQANNRDLYNDYIAFDSLVTERLDNPSICTLAGYPICPSLLFALTSINKTRLYDSAFDPTIECDIILAGVRVAKESSRNRAMDFTDEQAVNDIPKITLECEGKSLELSGTYALSDFKNSPDSCSIVIAISDDMAVAKQPAFLEALVRKEATFSVSYQTGLTKYWVADASLADNILSLTGTVLPPESLKTYVKTYWNQSLKAILTDLCKEIGIEYKTYFDDFSIEYFQSKTTPIDAINNLLSSAGLFMSWRQNVLSFVEPPQVVAPTIEIEAITTPDDTGMPIYTGCDWRDGINKFIEGDLSGETAHILSSFRCTSDKAAKNCLRLAKQNQRIAILNTAIVQNLVQGSAVLINSNGTHKAGFVTNFENNILSGQSRIEVAVVE